MATSVITRAAISNAFKDLLKEKSFDSISVSEICRKCNLNRKSFYYHFVDKYDLVNSIFQKEITDIYKNEYPSDIWEFLQNLFIYFYQNREYYRKILKVQGQNSFSEFFSEFLYPYAFDYLKNTIFKHSIIENKYIDLYTKLFIDFILSTVKNWLNTDDCLSGKEFILLIKYFVENLTVKSATDMGLIS